MTTTSVEDRRILLLGSQIRQEYIRRKQRLEPRWKIQPRQDGRALWNRCAENADRHGLNAQDYVAMFFEAPSLSHLVIYPTVLSSVEQAARLAGGHELALKGVIATDPANPAKAVDAMTERLRSEFESAIRALVSKYGDYRILPQDADFLVGRVLNLDPIVAYCLLYPDPEVDRRYGTAVRQRWRDSSVLRQALSALSIDERIFQRIS